MKKACILALALVLALMGMSAAAEEKIKSVGSGYYAVLFSNGYTGFCIDGKIPPTGQKMDFTPMAAAAARSNVPEYTEYNEKYNIDLYRNPYNPQTDAFYTNLKIDQYLKAAICASP